MSNIKPIPNCLMCKGYYPKDPLIIVANGPSVTPKDIEMIKPYNSFAIKGSYRMFPKLNWWPKYWGYFDSEWIKSGNRVEEVTELIKSKKVPFVFTFKGDGLPEENTITLTPLAGYYEPDPSIIFNENYIKEKAIEGLMRLKKINKNQALIEFYNLCNEFNITADKRFNYTAYLKLASGRNLSNNDIIVPGQRFIRPKEPKILDSFFCEPTSSALTACRVGSIIGHKKIILLGVDLNYNAETDNNYWSQDICDSNDPIITNKQNYITELATKFNKVKTWKDYLDVTVHMRHVHHFEKYKINNPDVKVINCSLNSRLNCFPKMNLKDALNV